MPYCCDQGIPRPDELAAIQALRTLLLGKVPPTAPTPPQANAPLTIIDKEPVVIWNPDEVQQPTRDGGANSPTSAPAQVNTPASIDDDSDDKSLPPTSLRRLPRSHTSTPSTTTARTRLHVCTYMINCVIANHVLIKAQQPSPPTDMPTLRQGYAFAAHLLQHNELHSAANASEHFIGAVINNDTGDVLEFQNLIKSEKYKKTWERSFANKLGRLFQGIRDILARTGVSSFEKRKSQNSSAPPMVTLSAMCVCVCVSCPPVTVVVSNYAIPIARSFH